MDLFCLHSNQTRETVEAFNARLREYAKDQPVVGLSVSTVGQQLVIGLLSADMADAEDGMPCIVPQVSLVNDQEGHKLEEDLNALAQDTARQVEEAWADPANDEDAPLPLTVQFLPAGKKTWMVQQFIYGQVVGR